MELSDEIRTEILESLSQAKDQLGEFMAEISLITFEWAKLLDAKDAGEFTADEVVDKFTEFLKPVLLRDLYRMMDPVVGPVIDGKMSVIETTLDATRASMVE